MLSSMRPMVLVLTAAAACSRSVAVGGTTGVPSDSLDLVIAGTTDTHGWLRGWDYYANIVDSTRGLSRLATVIDSLRLSNPGRVVLVDAGDLLQGKPITSGALRDTRSEERRVGE